MKSNVKKAIMGGIGDKPEQGTPAYEKRLAMKSGKQIAKYDKMANKMLQDQIKGKWQK
jgi:hypothetical protein